MNYTTQKNELNTQFTTELETAQEIYADSTMKQDGLIDQQLTEIQNILDQMKTLNETVSGEIEDTTQLIQNAALVSTVDVSEIDYNPAHTAEQMMKDSETLYDQHRLLLVAKVCIVLLILVKGNEVYTAYRLLFAGGSLACIFIYFMYILFSK
jgi:hypothetical protein